MVHPILLGDTHVNFVFGFVDATFHPVILEPQYGKFELYQHRYDFNEDGVGTFTQDPIKVTDMEFQTDSPDDREKWGVLYTGREKGGIYTAEDLNQLELQGSTLDYSKKYVELRFVPCQSDAEICATKENYEQFMATHSFFLFNLDNFVDMEDVQPDQDPLQQIINGQIIAKINPEKQAAYHYFMNEHRITLVDDISPSFGFGESK